MDILAQNLAQLTRQYFEDTDASAAARLIDTSDESTLERLLRSHWVEQPLNADIARRDAIDELIAYMRCWRWRALPGACRLHYHPI